MGTITAFESITLDGVMQAPGRPDEDIRGGFPHGGWAVDFNDETMMKFAGSSMGETRALLFGHRTYDDTLGFWQQSASLLGQPGRRGQLRGHLATGQVKTAPPRLACADACTCRRPCPDRGCRSCA